MSHPPAGPEIRPGAIFLEPTEWEGYLGYAIKIDKVLAHRRTKYQELHVVEAGPLGRVLLLNGSIQLSTVDEPAYHEMLAHLPLLCHRHPRRVLIIGGGDGGTLREVLKHPEVELAELCEIDQEVIRACREFMPQVACAFDDPRARVHVGDGIEFVRGVQGVYDLILVDSSDPEGPALGLFGRRFYQDLKKALAPGGLVVSQAESFNFYAPLLEEMFSFLQDMFEHAYYYLALVPTYLGGTIGFAYASLGPTPEQGPDLKRLAGLGRMRYYTPALHRAAFALPAHYFEHLPPKLARRQAGLWSGPG